MAPARKKQRLSHGDAVEIQTSVDEPPEEGLPKATETVAQAEKGTTQQQRSLFVRSLPADTTTESLTELFSQSYPIKHATAVIDPETKQCRGYGFVTFADAEDATRAKLEFQGHLLDGRKLRVEVAEPRNRDGEGEKPERKAKEVEHPPKLIVRNLPWSIKRADQLTKLFLSYGKVKDAYIPTKAPGLMSGFGFVIMRGKKNAEKALKGVNGKEIDGRTLAVDWAVEKKVFQGAAIENDSVEAQRIKDVEVDDIGVDGAAENGEPNLDDNEQTTEEAQDDLSIGSNDQLNSEDEPSDADSDDNTLEDRSSTLFIRNLPFTCTDEELEDHFAQFGSTRYARIVMDFGTERSKGNGFVCFYKKDDADVCLRNAPRRPVADSGVSKDGKMAQASHSVLQNENADPTGSYTLGGRVLQVMRAVDKSEASRLTAEGAASRNSRDKDKRRLYLLSEGTISSRSKLWEKLSKSEIDMRDASNKQRKKLIETNPSLHLSLTRLSVRNIPRSVDSKELKALARDAVVGFATDVKAGQREKLSKEELSRAGEEMQAAELSRKNAGKGVVKQAKVVFEGTSGSKVREDTGAGRSRGYGFIEYYTHRNALMGLRWLNGHAVEYQVRDGATKPLRDDIQERKKRLIVEFAIENAQVVLRRSEREVKARDRSRFVQEGLNADTHKANSNKARLKSIKSNLGKRKRGAGAAKPNKKQTGASDTPKGQVKAPVDEKMARRNQIIGRKRAMRQSRKGGKP